VEIDGTMSMSQRSAALARGLASLSFGVTALAWPGMTSKALAYAFGLFALAVGLIREAEAIAALRRRADWGAQAAGALVGMLFGVLALASPGAAVYTVLYTIAAWMVAVGAVGLAAATGMPRGSGRRFSEGAAAAVSVAAGFALMLFPGSGVRMLVVFTGIYAVAAGVLGIAQVPLEGHRAKKGPA